MCPITIRASDVLDKDVVHVDALDSVSSAIKLMLGKNVWSLVVSKSGLPVGFVSERDIIRRCFGKSLDPETTKLEKVMSSPLVTAEPETPLVQVMTLMASKNIRRVYIVEKGQIVGRVTQTDAFNEILKLMMALSQIG